MFSFSIASWHTGVRETVRSTSVIQIHQQLPKIVCHPTIFLWLICFLTFLGKQSIFSIISQNSGISILILLQCLLFCFHEEKMSQEHTCSCPYSQIFELTCIGKAQSSCTQLYVLVFTMTMHNWWVSLEQKTILFQRKLSSFFSRVPLLQLFLFVLYHWLSSLFNA